MADIDCVWLLKSLEKVLVQNIQFGLSPSLTEAIRSIPRWKFVQSSLPHVMLCTAQLINERYVDSPVPESFSADLNSRIRSAIAGRIRETCRMWEQRPVNCCTRCTGPCWMQLKNVRMLIEKLVPCPETLTLTSSISPASR